MLMNKANKTLQLHKLALSILALLTFTGALNFSCCSTAANASGDTDMVYRLETSLKELQSARLDVERKLDYTTYLIQRLNRCADINSVARALDSLQKEKRDEEYQYQDVLQAIKDVEGVLRVYKY